MSIDWKKHTRLIILLLILISLVVFFGYKLLFEMVDFSPEQKIVTKYIQVLNSYNARCFEAKPVDRKCTCEGVGCCGSSVGFYYDFNTDICHKIKVENSGAPFKSMDECENACRTMIYDKLGSNYVKIDKIIYYIPTRTPLEGGDINSFVVLSNFFGQDVNSVYYTSQRIQLADSKSFSGLSAEYSKDDKDIFYKAEVIKDVDYDSFEVLKNKIGESIAYAKDKNYIYINGSIFTLADVNSFQVLRYPYSKDKNHVYIFKDIVLGQDPASFQ